MGRLRRTDAHITRKKLRESLARTDPVHSFVRQLYTVQRRTYSVPNVNSLWHIDGLHCFIRWRMVIHGGIDGYSRLIVYLSCSNNNRADTVHHVSALTRVVKTLMWRILCFSLKDYIGEATSLVALHTMNGLSASGETRSDVLVHCTTHCFICWKTVSYIHQLMRSIYFAYITSFCPE